MSMQTQHYTKLNEPKRKIQYRRNCENCTREILSYSRSSEVLCKDCKKARRRVENPKTTKLDLCAWEVVSCPDDQYRRGAKFSDTEITAMKMYGGFEPGMILDHNGNLKKAINNYMLVEVNQ